MDQTKAMPGMSLSHRQAIVNLCGDKEHSVYLVLKSRDGTVSSDRLYLKRDSIAEDSSHRFFETAAIPGMIFVILLVALLLFKRVSFSFLVENLHWLTAILAALWGVIHYATGLGHKMEDIVSGRGRFFSSLSVTLIGLLLMVVCLRVQYVEELTPANRRLYSRRGVLVEKLKRYRKLRRTCGAGFLLVGVAAAVLIYRYHEDVDDCMYASSNYSDIRVSSDTTLLNGNSCPKK
jgi:hypothetical protein